MKLKIIQARNPNFLEILMEEGNQLDLKARFDKTTEKFRIFKELELTAEEFKRVLEICKCS